MKLFLYEILAKLNAAETYADRVQILHENAGFELHTLLQANFDRSIIFDLPEGAPPYKKDDGDPDGSIARMSNVLRELPQLLTTSKLDRLRKERKFVGILESVNEKDAEVMIDMKDKNLKRRCPTLTLELIHEAIPGLIRN